jgi:hypothetical protein
MQTTFDTLSLDQLDLVNGGNEAVKSYAKECAKGAVAGAIGGAPAGPKGAAVGAALGCLSNVATHAIDRNF